MHTARLANHAPPRGVKRWPGALAEFAARNVLWPAYHLDARRTRLKALHELERTQWLLRSELDLLRSARLRALVRHAFEHVPFYREKMRSAGARPEDVRTVADLPTLPIVTKDELRDAGADALDQRVPPESLRWASTGGSTGIPLRVARDPGAAARADAALVRGRSWAGVRLSDRGAAIRTIGSPSLLGSIRMRFLRTDVYPAFGDDTAALELLRALTRRRPAWIQSYASCLVRLATIAERSGVTPRVPVAFSTGERMLPEDRVLVEKVFACNLYDYYGSNEVGGLAFECEHRTKHVADENVILEAVASEGQPAPGPAEILVTDLYNEVMPFIRYRNGDVGSLSSEPCACGRSLTTLATLEGRTQDFLVARDGSLVPAIFFPIAFRDLHGIRQYQIEQTSHDHVEIRYVPDRDFTPATLHRMVTTIRERLGHGVEVMPTAVAEVPRTPRGKTPLVVSRMRSPGGHAP